MEISDTDDWNTEMQPDNREDGRGPYVYCNDTNMIIQFHVWTVTKIEHTMHGEEVLVHYQVGQILESDLDGWFIEKCKVYDTWLNPIVLMTMTR